MVSEADIEAVRKVLLVHSGEEFTADEFPTFEDGQRAWAALDRIAAALRPPGAA